MTRIATMSKAAHWLGRAESTLDAGGRPAWIAAMVGGFILFWPLGLALLGYMIWSGRLSGGDRRAHVGLRFRSSGNAAFDAYRDATLRRLEEEQEAFQRFLERLRKAKDHEEFERFMKERGQKAEADEPVAA